MTLDTQLQEIIETAKQKGHHHIVAFPVGRKFDEILALEPLARFDLTQQRPSRVTGNGFYVVFGKTKDFSKMYHRDFFKKCTESPIELQFETY